jgi:hypothetical protein
VAARAPASSALEAAYWFRVVMVATALSKISPVALCRVFSTPPNGDLRQLLRRRLVEIVDA